MPTKGKQDWTLRDLRGHYLRAIREGYLPHFEEASKEYSLPVEALLAIASRETNMRNILGDGGHGHGIMQVDDRSYPAWCATDEWKDVRKAILKGTEALHSKVQYLKRNGLPNDEWKCFFASYNKGEGRVLKGYKAKVDVDLGTTKNNYGEDTLKRMKVFQALRKVKEGE